MGFSLDTEKVSETMTKMSVYRNGLFDEVQPMERKIMERHRI